MGAHTAEVPRVDYIKQIKRALTRVDVGDLLLYFGAGVGLWLAGILLTEMSRWKW